MIKRFQHISSMIRYFVPVLAYLAFEVGSTETETGEKPRGCWMEGPMGEGKHFLREGETLKDTVIISSPKYFVFRNFS